MAQHSRIVAIIEDEPASAEALALVLRDWGAEVTVGVDTMEIADKLGPRVAEIGWIITHCDAQGGAEDITQVDQITAAAPTARVLVLSGAMHRAAAAAAARAGFEVMDKPARPDKIVAWLERA